MTRTRILCAIIPLLTTAVTGCGDSNPNAPASVSGEISYQGKPLTGGMVVFFAPDGTPYGTTIGTDGTYSIKDIPAGELVITVSTEVENQAKQGRTDSREAEMRSKREASSIQPPPGGRGGSSDGGGASGPVVKYIKIPEKYSKNKTSPLTFTVKPGRQVHNIELD